MINKSQATTLRLPANRFYWGVLDVSLLNSESRSRPGFEQYGFLLESLLPVPLDSVQTVYRRIEDNRVVACAISKAFLDDKRNEWNNVIALMPDSIPEPVVKSINGNSIETDKFNVLVGPYTPPAIQSIKRRLARHAVIAMTLVVLLILFGIERRTAAYSSSIEKIKAGRLGIIDRVMPSTAASTQPPEIRMITELRRLQQTRGNNQSQVAQAELFDSTQTLEHLLKQWPQNMHTMAETITLTSTSINLRIAVPTEEAEYVSESFLPWDDWQKLQPEFDNRSGSSVITIQLTRLMEGET